MAIKIKLYQQKREDLQGKWYGRAIKTGEVNTKQLAHIISQNNSVTESDVQAVIVALVQEMKMFLNDGYTVVLDDFGRFHLTVQSDMVDKKEDFNLKKHIRRILCKFTPSAHRNPFTRKLERPFCDDVELERTKQ
ncbi:MAG: HU family DNA-binding protein [Prevotella sp.]|nr:HU family DNA-binding protein [Prevotella sp.]